MPQAISFVTCINKHKVNSVTGGEKKPIFLAEKQQAVYSLESKKISLSEARGFGLDPSNLTVEKFPLMVSPVPEMHLKRIY